MDLMGILRVQGPMRGDREIFSGHFNGSRGPIVYFQVVCDPVGI